eukprot:IDg23453t1
MRVAKSLTQPQRSEFGTLFRGRSDFDTAKFVEFNIVVFPIINLSTLGKSRAEVATYTSRVGKLIALICEHCLPRNRKQTLKMCRVRRRFSRAIKMKGNRSFSTASGSQPLVLVEEANSP